MTEKNDHLLDEEFLVEILSELAREESERVSYHLDGTPQGDDPRIGLDAVLHRLEDTRREVLIDAISALQSFAQTAPEGSGRPDEPVDPEVISNLRIFVALTWESMMNALAARWTKGGGEKLSEEQLLAKTLEALEEALPQIVLLHVQDVDTWAEEQAEQFWGTHRPQVANKRKEVIVDGWLGRAIDAKDVFNLMWPLQYFQPHFVNNEG